MIHVARFLRYHLKAAPWVSSHFCIKSFGDGHGAKANMPPKSHRITEIKGTAETFSTDKTKKNLALTILTGTQFLPLCRSLPLEMPLSIFEYLQFSRSIL